MYQILFYIGSFPVRSYGVFLLERWAPRARAGRTFLAYLGLYSAGRFFVEYLRDDSLLIAGVLRTAQVASIFGVLAAILLHAYLGWRHSGKGVIS